MEEFYEDLMATDVSGFKKGDLDKALDKLMLSYASNELELMFYLTRIVYREQFTVKLAGESLVGEGYRKFVGAHVGYLDKLVDAGLLRSKEKTKYYGEIYARLALSFGMQFLHPNIVPTLQDQKDLSGFMHELIRGYEENLGE